MQQIDVTISIVSYNSRKVLDQCLQSVIRAAEGLNTEIIVVDNASSDASADFVRSAFPEVIVRANEENLGFGRAHNQAFRISGGRYFLILNPDTRIEPDALHTMVEFLDAHERAGAAGCKIFWDDEKTFMFPDLRIHGLRSAVIHFTPYALLFPDSLLSQWYWKAAHRVWSASQPLEVEGVTGGLIMVRREAFVSAGLFDETFFLFFEEHDLLRRMKKHGWKIFYLPDARIQHFYEESFRNSAIDAGAVFIQSALSYYRKYYGAPGYLFIRFLLFAGKAMQRLTSGMPAGMQNYEEISPVHDRLSITWPPQKGASRYLVEISYSPVFNDRGGMYASGERLSLNSTILKQLPNSVGFLRIIPVYEDNTIGRVIRFVKIAGE